MKLTITHLKAPWPAGAKVGDVIDLPAVPSWAAGKCVPADDDAAVTVGDKPAIVANVVLAADPAPTPKPAGPPNQMFTLGRGKRKG